MRTLKDLLKRLLCWALLLALLVLAAAGTVLGVQGWKLYRATQPELPAAQLYETLSARPGFTTCDAIPRPISTPSSPWRTAGSSCTTAWTRWPSSGRCGQTCGPARWPKAAAP